MENDPIVSHFEKIDASLALKDPSVSKKAVFISFKRFVKPNQHPRLLHDFILQKRADPKIPEQAQNASCRRLFAPQYS